jgi:hypothetical protein
MREGGDNNSCDNKKSFPFLENQTYDESTTNAHIKQLSNEMYRKNYSTTTADQ